MLIIYGGETCGKYVGENDFLIMSSFL